MRPQRSLRSRIGWIAGAIVLPTIVIGSLLGVVAEGETALERVPVALVNNDELITEIGDDGEEEFIFASKPLVSELVGNEDLQLDWVITNSEQANVLLANGGVYAIFEIPENFSQSVMTLGTNSPEQATFTIRTDPSRSYLAGVLVDQLGPTISASVSRTIGREITSGLYSALFDVGEAFQETADGASEIADGVDSLAEGTSELATGVGELRTGTADFATGYQTFDDGLGEYLGGVRSLSEGISAFEVGTRGLGDLSTGISQYTGGVSQVSAGLSALNNDTSLAGLDSTVKSNLQTLLGTLAGIAAGGSTLSAQSSTALTGVRDGIVGINSGAGTLGTSSRELESGSGEIRTGLDDLAAGVADLDDGVVELDDGVQELAGGMREFADALDEGATEIREQGLGEPTEAELDVLTSPVAFEQQNRDGELGLLETVSSLFVPIGLWFVALVFFLTRPALNNAMLSGTAASRVVLIRSLRPVLVALAGHTAVATTLLHAVGGVAWSNIVWTLPLVALGSASFLALHYALWLWRSGWLGPVSITLGVLQIITLGSLLPREILPSVYQVFTGITPMSWFIDSLQAALGGVDPTRVLQNASALAASVVVAFLLAAMALRAGRARAKLQQLGLESFATAEPVKVHSGSHSS
jgi:putative membrane protein